MLRSLMLEVIGNMWGYAGRGKICITTNGSVTRDGRAVLGRGCARQAAERLPDLARRLGGLVQSGGNHVHDLHDGLVSFPVEETAWSLPDPELIGRSAGELRQLADEQGWQLVILPRPGCGFGGLDWSRVRPLLAPHLDHRFLVISQP